MDFFVDTICLWSLTKCSSTQMVVEALSLELPKVVVKFISLSDQCQQTAQSIIDGLVATCSPRDMLAILCEVVIVAKLSFF